MEARLREARSSQGLELVRMMTDHDDGDYNYDSDDDDNDDDDDKRLIISWTGEQAVLHW